MDVNTLLSVRFGNAGVTLMESVLRHFQACLGIFAARLFEQGYDS